MKPDNNKDDFIERKTGRRKHLKNKALNKRDQIEDHSEIPRAAKKENKRRIEDLRQEELWEDWDQYYNH